MTEFTLYSSHTVWSLEEDFVNWTKSQSFRLAHKDAGKNSNIGHQVFEGFKAISQSGISCVSVFTHQ